MKEYNNSKSHIAVVDLGTLFDIKKLKFNDIACASRLSEITSKLELCSRLERSIRTLYLICNSEFLTETIL
jgi:hypothetical protein